MSRVSRVLGSLGGRDAAEEVGESGVCNGSLHRMRRVDVAGIRRLGGQRCPRCHPDGRGRWLRWLHHHRQPRDRHHLARQQPKIKKVYWVTKPNAELGELYWELRYDPGKGGGSENYFGNVDLACGESSIKVQARQAEPEDPERRVAVHGDGLQLRGRRQVRVPVHGGPADQVERLITRPPTRAMNSGRVMQRPELVLLADQFGRLTQPDGPADGIHRRVIVAAHGEDVGQLVGARAGVRQRPLKLIGQWRAPFRSPAPLPNTTQARRSTSELSGSSLTRSSVSDWARR